MMNSMKRSVYLITVTALVISLLAGAFPFLITSAEAKDEVNSNIMVDVPWGRINKCGHQAVSGPCQAYCWAYCRIILDNTAHTYRDYWTGSQAVAPSAAGYSSQTTKMTSKQKLLQTICSSVDLGRPVVVRVRGTGRAPFHFVVAIGYRANCDRSNLKESDILILDPASNSIKPRAGSKETYTYLNSCTLSTIAAGERSDGYVGNYVCWTTSSGGTALDKPGVATYTVMFNPNEGSVFLPNMSVTNGDIYNSLPNPTRDGYAFAGWFTEKSGGSQITPTTIVNLKGNQTLYAHWTKNPEKMCTVTFNANGGTVSQKTVQVPKGSTLASLPTPTRSGYTFVCWSNTNGASGLTIEAGKYIVEQDVTLYAWWKEEKTQSTGHWGPWSNWSAKVYAASNTRQVESKEVQTVAAHTEYRYGRYIDQTGKNNCWCAKYLESLSYISGKAKLDYSSWSSTRYSPSGSTWTCGQCNGTHKGVDHVDSKGRPIWAEYRISGKPYYWEETRIVGAQYETQYRYRDWIID